MTSRWTGFRSPLKAGMEMFLAHKRALGYQVRTTESVLRLLDGFLVEQSVETIEAVTPTVIEAFLASHPRTSPHSFNQLLGIVARLFDWLIARDAARVLNASSVGSHRLLLSIERPKILDRTAFPPAIYIPHISQVLEVSTLEGVLNERSRGGALDPRGPARSPRIPLRTL